MRKRGKQQYTLQEAYKVLLDYTKIFENHQQEISTLAL